MAETRPLARRTRVKQRQNEDFRLPQPNASGETKEEQGQKENNDVKVMEVLFGYQKKNILLECQWECCNVVAI